MRSKATISFPKVSEDIVDFDESVLKVLKKALQNDPENRFQSANEFTQALNGEIEIEDVDGLKEVYVEEKINPDDVKKMYIEYLKETQGADQHIDEDKIPPFNYQKTTIIQVDENEQIIKSEIKLKLDNGMDKMESSTILKILK